jgi:hypothetical protein
MKREREYISRWPSVNLRIPETIREELEAEAQHRMLSVSAVVREALRQRYESGRRWLVDRDRCGRLLPDVDDDHQGDCQGERAKHQAREERSQAPSLLAMSEQLRWFHTSSGRIKRELGGSERPRQGELGSAAWAKS